MSTIYITSDQHFHHTNVITYESRPFNDAEEMNSYMIKKWNSKVSKKDKIYFLGDLCIPSQKYKEIVPLLNGYKIMIMGNHDVLSHKRYFEVGFEEVSKYPIILQDKFILSHQPQNLDITSQFFNIHGHSHSKRPHDSKHFNVSVELHDYTPVKLIDIIAYFNKFEGVDVIEV